MNWANLLIYLTPRLFCQGNFGLGVLRMLNCGSAATPLPAGEKGAYGKIIATGRVPVTSYATVLDLVRRDRTAAQAYLAQNNFTAEEQADILRTSHCRPPESYLILGHTLIYRLFGWTRLGLWDPRRAYIAQRVRFMSKPKAVNELVQRLGIDKQRAEDLYMHVQGLTSERQVRQYIAPRQRLLSTQWLPCYTEDTRLICPLQGQFSSGHRLESFVHVPAAPTTSHFRVRRLREGELSQDTVENTPAVLLLADPQGIDEVQLPTPAYRTLGVLLDVPQQRVLVGTLTFLRSIYTHLMYLDGRYLRHYEKIKEKSTTAGDRVVTWKIHWPER